jgi:NTE family protein
MVSETTVEQLTENFVICSNDFDEDLQEAYTFFRNKYKNFVFQGGGIRGIAYGGSIRYLEKHNLLKQVKRFAGSSAGAIVAAGLAVGYSGSEIIQLLHETDFKKFEKGSWGIFGEIYRFITKFGLYSGDAFEEWFKKVLEKKTGNSEITFLELYNQFNKELVITGTNLSKKITEYYYYKRTPNMPIYKAVRISMSYPGFFECVKRGNETLADGGLLNNYPIWVFDGKFIGDPHVTDEDVSKSETFGFKLMTDNEKKDYKLYHDDESIEDPIQCVKAILNTMLIGLERSPIRPGYWDKTVCINTHNVSSMELNIPDETKQKLIQSAYDSVHQKMQDLQTKLLREHIQQC